MPAAIPLAIAGATMVANNVQQKAAIKNNENQQATAVGNAQQAAQQAFQRQNQWMQGHPSPFSGGINIARPPGFAPTNTISGQAPPPNVAGIMGMAHNNLAFGQPHPFAGPGGNGSVAPGPMNGLTAIMQSMFGRTPGAPAPGGAGPTGFAQHIMSNVAPPAGPPMVNTQPVPAPYGVGH